MQETPVPCAPSPPHEAHCTESLLHSVAADLRMAALLQRGGPASAAGSATATTAFPFDVVPGDVALAKTTLLVIDLDAVVYDCVRVQRWCTDVGNAAGMVSPDAAAAATPAAAVKVPTLTRLFCCFLTMVRGIIAKTSLTVELVLGNCRDALADIGAAAVDTDASVSAVEVASVWLQVHQAVVLFLAGGGGGGVGKSIAFFTTAEPGWAGAAVRVRLHSESSAALNLQVLPLLWSTDTRAFFATATTDVVVSSWLSCCSHELGQLCGRSLPTLLLLPRCTPSVALPVAMNSLCSPSSAVPERLLIRHAPSTARRLGLTAAAYLPALYALLSLHDTQRSAAAAEKDRRCAVVAGPMASVGAGDLPSPSASAAADVARAAALVNHYAGVLHADLVTRWVSEAAAAPHAAAPLAETPEPHPDATSRAAQDLAPSLWHAQGVLSTLTARHLVQDRHVRTIWAGGQWKARGPPPLSCALSTSRPFCPPTSKPTALGVMAEGEAAAAAVMGAPGEVAVRLRPLRLQLLRLARHIFPVAWQSRDAAGDETSAEAGLTTVLGRSVYISCLLAEPLGDTVAPSTTTSAPRETASAVTLARDVPPAWPLVFQTRGSLDDIREHFRPAAQLTVVALSLLWRCRLWREETCLRVLGFYLAYCEAEATVGVREAYPPALATAAAGAGEERAHDTDAIPCGVRTSEVAEWWHAVSCVTLLQSLSTRLTHEPLPARTPNDAAVGTLGEPGAVLTGCLPGASYGEGDRVAFGAFLRRGGYLLRDRGEAVADECGASLMTAARLERLRRVLPSPACCDEVMHGHRIFELLSAALLNAQ